MADRFNLGANAVRALSKSQQRTRTESYAHPQLPEARGLRQAKKSTAIGVVQEDIAPRAEIFAGDQGFLKSGHVRLMFAQADGSLLSSFEFVVAFNFLDREVKAGEFVTMILDWQTGRWIIVSGMGFARRLYFKTSSAFGIGNATFSAELVNYFQGFDPRGKTWSPGGTDTIVNPPTAGGEHFFAGASGAYGFAEWHDADAITPGNPSGYWCYQLQCSVS